MAFLRSARLAVLAALAAPLLLLAACGDDASDAQPSSASTPAESSDGGAFPVTIEHAFGETTIEEAPTRVVTWGWGSGDASIALGVVPVAIPFADYGADDEGVLPWIREALDAHGDEVELPAILPNTDEAPIEAIAAAEPDLILAVYSGITDAEYELLSAVAPTVAYPGGAWSTPWRETIEIVGTALGKADEATQLLADIDGEVAAAAEAHPELAGKTVAMVWDAAGTFYVYKPADARVEFAEALGLVSAPSVDELSTDESTFYFTLSYEQLGSLTSDILVNFSDTPELSEAFLASEPARLMAQVQQGAVAQVTGPEFVASVSPPTALSLTWGLDEYVSLLSEAAAAVG